MQMCIITCRDIVKLTRSDIQKRLSKIETFAAERWFTLFHLKTHFTQNNDIYFNKVSVKNVTTIERMRDMRST